MWILAKTGLALAVAALCMTVPALSQAQNRVGAGIAGGLFAGSLTGREPAAVFHDGPAVYDGPAYAPLSRGARYGDYILAADWPRTGYHGGAPGYGYRSGYELYGCYWQVQRFWDGYGWRTRRARVCG